MINKWQISILVVLGLALFTGLLIRVISSRSNLQLSLGEQVQEGIEEENESIYVHIGGEVNKAGVYKVRKNARLFEVVKKAGGLKDDADLSSINLATTIKDGEKILIPAKKAVVVEEVYSSKGGSEKPKKVNINSADYNELVALPIIGDKLAKRIIEYREKNGKFRDIEELKLIKGIGDKNFKQFQEFIIVE